MCLGIPGEIVSIQEEVAPASGGHPRTASVDFQGSRVEVSLSLVPQAKLHDWVLVHAGFALTLLNAEEAAETWRWLDQAELAREMGPAGGAGTGAPR